MGLFGGFTQVYLLVSVVNTGPLALGREKAGVPVSVSHGQNLRSQIVSKLGDVFC